MKLVIRVLLAQALALSLMWGQTAVGRIVGTIVDVSGAVLPGAAITVKNERTGQERTAVADGGGEYVVPQLGPASYTIIASKGGFSDVEAKNVVLQVGEESRHNLVLGAANVNTVVTVDGGALATVDTSSAREGVNVSEREVKQLPLNGRQVSQLYLMAPGAVNNGSGNFDNIRFSGRSNQQNAIRFDGIEGGSIVDASPGNLNGEISSGFRLQQSLENVQEFRIDSSNFPAEYGTGTGGQISFITKSGSNDTHGSLLEYFRNDEMDARNFFARSQA
jgi:hypothetical protein